LACLDLEKFRGSIKSADIHIHGDVLSLYDDIVKLVFSITSKLKGTILHELCICHVLLQRKEGAVQE
jgi:hypothetical protein